VRLNRGRPYREHREHCQRNGGPFRRPSNLWTNNGKYGMSYEKCCIQVLRVFIPIAFVGPCYRWHPVNW
jgi:hypothetical protein